MLALRTGGYFGVDCKALRPAVAGAGPQPGLWRPFPPAKCPEIYAKFRAYWRCQIASRGETKGAL